MAESIVDILVVRRDTGTIDRFTAGVRTHQVHACAVGHPQVADLLAFRDDLRARPARAAAYGALEETRAHCHRRDIVGSMRGTDAFIKVLIAETRAWTAPPPRDGQKARAKRGRRRSAVEMTRPMRGGRASPR